MCSVPPGPSPAAVPQGDERDLGHAVGEGGVEHPAVAAVVLVHALGRRAQLVVHDQDRPRLGRDLGEGALPAVVGVGEGHRIAQEGGLRLGQAQLDAACRGRGRLARTGGRRRRRRRRCRDRRHAAPSWSSAAAIRAAAASALAAGKRAGLVPPGPRTLGSSIMWPLNRTTLAGSAGAPCAPSPAPSRRSSCCSVRSMIVDRLGDQLGLQAEVAQQRQGLARGVEREAVALVVGQGRGLAVAVQGRVLLALQQRELGPGDQRPVALARGQARSPRPSAPRRRWRPGRASTCGR